MKPAVPPPVDQSAKAAKKRAVLRRNIAQAMLETIVADAGEAFVLDENDQIEKHTTRAVAYADSLLSKLDESSP